MAILCSKKGGFKNWEINNGTLIQLIVHHLIDDDKLFTWFVSKFISQSY